MTTVEKDKATPNPVPGWAGGVTGSDDSDHWRQETDIGPVTFLRL